MSESKNSTQIATPSQFDPWTDIGRLFDNFRSPFYEVFDLARAWEPGSLWSSSFDRTRSPFRAAAADMTDTGDSYKILWPSCRGSRRRRPTSASAVRSS